ncbi:ThuA domain-containing protein [Planctomycetota bacterium]
MRSKKTSLRFILALVFLSFAWTPVRALENDSVAPLPIKLPKPSFTGTPLNYKSPILEPPTLRRRPPFLAPASTKNIAFGMPVTASVKPMTGTLDMIVDGEKGYQEKNRVDLQFGPQWVQIDLGAEHEVYAIIVWHYHAADRVYFDVVAQTSLDADGIQGVNTHYNNDHNNSLGLGTGQDKEYIEDFQGRLIDAKGSLARFVRLHSNGNTSNDSNHYLEVEVWGRPVSTPTVSAYEVGGVEDKRYVISPENRSKIMAVLPDQAPAIPKQPRKLLIFDLNVVYGGHKSRFYTNFAFQETGKKTGAFETVITSDPNVFKKENLSEFDAVFFNSTVGNQFTDPQLRQNLVEFVYGGGGFMGVHGTTMAFWNWGGAKKGDDWPEFGTMLGGRGANHRAMQEQVTMKVDAPGHPLMTPFPAKSFDLCDEFFRVSKTYSRDRCRVLFSIDVEKTDLSAKSHEREDKDYACAWVRHYGRGRVFYSTVGHNPYQFWDPTILKFYLGATQFVLGDLPVPTIPSGRVTPAIQAQEKLGWPLGMTAYTFHKYTLFETIEKTDQIGLAYLGGLSFQKVSKKINKNFDAQLSDEELKAIRLKLDDAGVRLLTSFYARIPGDDAGCRKVFEFARKMGIETLISEPPLEALDTIEKYCDEYDINLAIHNHGPKQSPNYWNPEAVMKVCQGRGPRIGVCADMGYWMRAGIDPVAAVKTIGHRLLVVQMHDLNELTAEGHDVPWGTGAGRTEAFLKEVHRLGIKPKMFGLEYSYDWFDSIPEVTQSARFFDKVILELAQ